MAGGFWWVLWGWPMAEFMTGSSSCDWAILTIHRQSTPLFTQWTLSHLYTDQSRNFSPCLKHAQTANFCLWTYGMWFFFCKRRVSWNWNPTVYHHFPMKLVRSVDHWPSISPTRWRFSAHCWGQTLTWSLPRGRGLLPGIGGELPPGFFWFFSLENTLKSIGKAMKMRLLKIDLIWKVICFDCCLRELYGYGGQYLERYMFRGMNTHKSQLWLGVNKRYQGFDPSPYEFIWDIATLGYPSLNSSKGGREAPRDFQATFCPVICYCVSTRPELVKM